MDSKKKEAKEIKLNVLVVGEKTHEISVVLIENWRYKFNIPIVEENKLGDLVSEFLKNEQICKNIPRVCDHLVKKTIGVELNKQFSEVVTGKLRESKNFERPNELKVKDYVEVFQKIQGKKTGIPFVEFDLTFTHDRGGNKLSPNNLYDENIRLKNRIEELIVEKREMRLERDKLKKGSVESGALVSKLKARIKTLTKKSEGLNKQLVGIVKQRGKREEQENELQREFRGLKKQYQANMKSLRSEYQQAIKKVGRRQAEFQVREKEYMQQFREYKTEMNVTVKLLREKEARAKKKLQEISKQFSKKVFHGVALDDSPVVEVMKKKEKETREEERASAVKQIKVAKEQLESVLKEINKSLNVLQK